MTNPSNCQLTTERADLLRYVSRRIGDTTVSEDIVQEAYLRLLTFEAKPGNRVSNVAALLRRISLNLVRDHSRSLRRHVTVELSDDIPCQEPLAQQQLERRQLISLVSNILQAMPRLRREVFIRRRMYGESAAEVAETLRLSPSAVSNHVARAMFDLDVAIEKMEKRGGSVRD